MLKLGYSALEATAAAGARHESPHSAHEATAAAGVGKEIGTSLGSRSADLLRFGRRCTNTKRLRPTKVQESGPGR